ncbi:simple sugar transport system ATP-binding protein [Thermosporothrix hazakensis]|jgi:simple sugar transport system ATP-binding protein|uniref:Simple sugar transport system ATP-binding protein n=1 Tax=Thermosporothrix hazakensis TaxID=644383 RepID=A0A326UG27_THEHA|nr:ABC transporter ATP-binding protein [Thermosporothrix hazakensis]PZW29533.1 simple sugar transport system ATP-binding protein [Thermosporothrix hazakensis]GCE45753.1 sugar ABC transporter ATP-binding protein [Thermosporothrix hazakensis]
MQELAVEMRDICKAWPGVIANDHVNLAVRKGEIHALMGENGAGKSTLMNILYGLIRPDSGEILVNNEAVHIGSPRDAIRRRIGMVHQHFMLIPPLTVAENIVLGHEPGGLAAGYNVRRARDVVKKLSEQYGLPIDPDARIEKLSVGLQQRVEILKALYRSADILIMDEPTGVLTPQETHELFGVLRGLVEQGKTIIFITHKLREVLELSDRITVLRRGRNVGELITRETNQAEIARLMVGREVLLRVEKQPATPGPDVLTVENLHARSDRGLEALRGVSFTLKAGEILGVAGVEGNGQSELVEVLTGTRKATAGRITMSTGDKENKRDRDITSLNAQQVRKVGVAHVPEDRRGSGLVLADSIEENMMLGREGWPRFSRSGWVLRWRSIAAWARRLMQEFDVRAPNTKTPVRALSGGNQQKVIIAREFSSDPRVLIASQPTRGVDIGAIEFIHRRIIEQRDAGKAVLVVSAELDEIRALSDRIAVMYEGRIVDIVSPDVSDEELGILMTGCRLEEAS